MADGYYVGGWKHEPVTIASPAVATGFAYRVPGSEAQRVFTVSFVLVTDANVAARIARVEFLNASSDVFAAVASPFTQAASKTTRYTFGVGMQQYGANDAAFIGAPIPDLFLRDGLSLRVAVTAIQAGDQISGISVFVAQRDTDTARAE